MPNELNFPEISAPDWGSFSVCVSSPIRYFGGEGGLITAEPRSGLRLRKWTLGWKSLSMAEYETLRDFMAEHHGSGFMFTPPGGSERFLVCIETDAIKFQTAVPGDRWNGSITLVELKR